MAIRSVPFFLFLETLGDAPGRSRFHQAPDFQHMAAGTLAACKAGDAGRFRLVVMMGGDPSVSGQKAGWHGAGVQPFDDPAFLLSPPSISFWRKPLLSEYRSG